MPGLETVVALLLCWLWLDAAVQYQADTVRISTMKWSDLAEPRAYAYFKWSDTLIWFIWKKDIWYSYKLAYEGCEYAGEWELKYDL